MLPQMMPLPWLMIFFLVFFCFFTVSFVLSGSHLSYRILSGKKMKSMCTQMPW